MTKLITLNTDDITYNDISYDWFYLSNFTYNSK